jgi:serine/threonine protein kinase
MHYYDPESIPVIWEVGDVILEKYEVREVFRGGGMGLVYRVYHNEWNIELAVKSPRSEYFQTTDALTSFEKEAETWVTLGLHPQITSCYYVRRLGGIPRIFSEYVNSGSIADTIYSKKLYQGEPEENLKKILDIAIQFAWGIQFAHENDLIHLDIKPSNALINSDGIVKVTDFGLAKAKSSISQIDSGHRGIGQTIYVKGSGYMTPAYASPEQASGEHLSTKTDIWSWAASLLEMMKGEVDWSHGQAAGHALKEYYGKSMADDPIAKLLSACLSLDPSRRPNAQECSQRLIGIYDSYFTDKYEKEYAKKEYLTSGSLNNRGLSMLDLGREEAAVNHFKEALKKDASNIQCRYNLLLTEWREGKISDENVICKIWENRSSKNADDVYEMLENINIERGIANSINASNKLSEENILSAGLVNVAKLKGSIILIRGRKANSEYLILSVTSNGWVNLHNSNGNELFEINLNTHILKCDLTENWKYLLFTTSHENKSFINRLDLLNYNIIKIISSQSAHVGLLYCLDVLDDKSFLTSGQDNAIIIWRIDDLSITISIDLKDPDVQKYVANGFPFSKHHLHALSAKLLPRDKSIITLHYGQVRLWSDLSTHSNPSIQNATSNSSKTTEILPQTIKVLKTPGAIPDEEVTVSKNGKFIVQGGYLPAMFDENGEYIRSLITNERGIKSFSIPDSTHLIYGIGTGGGIYYRKYRKAILVWNFHTGRLLRTIPLVDSTDSCSGKTISVSGDGEIFFVGLQNGTIQFGFQVANPKAAQYYISRPSSIQEIDSRDALIANEIEIAESFIDTGDYSSAFSIFEKLSKDYDKLLNPSVQRLELLLDTHGSKKSIKHTLLKSNLSIHINETNIAELTQPELFYNAGDYDVHINTQGTQVLWLPSGNSIGDFEDAILFDSKYGQLIKKGNFSQELWKYGGKGIWTISGSISSPFLIYINCESKIVRKLNKTGKNNIWRHVMTLDGGLLFTTSADQNVLWDPINAKPLSMYQYNDKYISTKACLSFNGREVILATGERGLEGYEFKKEGLFKSIRTKLKQKYSNQLTVNLKQRERYLAIVDKQRKVIHATYSGVEVLSYETGKVLHRLDDSGVTALCSVVDLPLVIVGHENGAISLINTSAGCEICKLAAIQTPVSSLLVTPDGFRLIVNGTYVFHLLWSYDFPNS